eukprot:2051110-Ditylum_brightwellii.AAC.1
MEYQDHMGAVDRGGQKCLYGADFLSKVHFKKWYKMGSFGASDFGVLNSHIDWNLSISRLLRNGALTRKPLKKWEFTCVAAEEMMYFVASLPEDRQSDDLKM